MSLSEVLPVCLTQEKIQVLRWDKDEDGLPERILKRITRGSLIHKEEPMDAKDLGWAIEVLTGGEQRGPANQRIEEDGGKSQRGGKEWAHRDTSELDQVFSCHYWLHECLPHKGQFLGSVFSEIIVQNLIKFYKTIVSNTVGLKG